MKQIMTIIALAITAITFTRCTKDNNTKIKKSNVTVINPPGTSTVTPTPTPTTTPTNPTDSFLNLKGKINSATWMDLSTYSVGSSVSIRLDWDVLPLSFQQVQVLINLYDAKDGATTLTIPISAFPTTNYYEATINTSKVTGSCIGQLEATVVPLTGSKKKQATLKAYLN